MLLVNVPGLFRDALVPRVSCWLSLAFQACLAHGWHVWHASAGSFWFHWEYMSGRPCFSRLQPLKQPSLQLDVFNPPAPYPLLLGDKFKFSPSVTDQRVGPSSWWPSNPIYCRFLLCRLVWKQSYQRWIHFLQYIEKWLKGDTECPLSISSLCSQWSVCM